jgi:hypothetical protein
MRFAQTPRVRREQVAAREDADEPIRFIGIDDEHAPDVLLDHVIGRFAQ